MTQTKPDAKAEAKTAKTETKATEVKVTAAKATEADDNTVKKTITIAGQVYVIEGIVDFSLTPLGGTVPDPDNPPTDPKPDKPSDFGTIKQGEKWSPSPGPSENWIVQKMKNPDTDYKLVSPLDQKNVVANLKSEEEAIALKKYFETAVFPPKEEGGTVPDPDPDPEPGTGVTGGGPYPQKVGSKTLESSQRGPTTRHYASGKPDDETVEKNVKDIPYRNYQFIVETTIKEMEHEDTISLKFGGQHMDGKGWWDTGINTNDGQTCLGTEPKHPKTNLCITKGPKIGSIQNKRVKIAGVFFEKNDHIELWTNIGDGWKKQVEGDHVGDLKPDHKKNHETQERIDGFKKGSVPDLHMAVVQEIEPKA